MDCEREKNTRPHIHNETNETKVATTKIMDIIYTKFVQ